MNVFRRLRSHYHTRFWFAVLMRLMVATLCIANIHEFELCLYDFGWRWRKESRSNDIPRYAGGVMVSDEQNDGTCH